MRWSRIFNGNQHTGTEETVMPDKNLKRYLNHHLAASVAWFEGLDDLVSAEKGAPMERALIELKAEALADRRVLEELMARLQVSESEMQKATAWLGEKVGKLFMPMHEQKGGPMHQLLMLEALSLGVEGRRGLWLALSAVSQEFTALQGLDYQVLIKRAEDQRERLERMRVEAARQALKPGQP
jgi:hypothetical protein